MNKSYPYNITKPKSIENYAKKIINKTLRDVIDIESFDLSKGTKPLRTKGSFGQALEKHYFKINPGSSKGPDFPEAGVELKSGGLIKLSQKISRNYSAKERMALGQISFINLCNEDWDNSSLMKKCKLMLLVFYLHEKNIKYWNFIIKLASLWTIPPNDIFIIKKDWETIKNKIKAGKAHELSEGDTLYLGACTKASTSKVLTRQPFNTIRAKPRAFSFKQKYVNIIIDELLAKKKDSEPIVKRVSAYQKGLTFEEIVINKFKPFVGKSYLEICKVVKLKVKANSKGRYNTITREILGIRSKKIEEFEKADIVIRTIRLGIKGTPEEHVSFPAFNYCDIIKENWDNADIREILEKRFFWVIYQYDKNEGLRLKGVMFWNMPYTDLNNEVKKVWKLTKSRIIKGEYESLPKISESTVSHIRPHARDKKDTIITPSGTLEVKKSFWLNAKYVKSQIDANLS